MNLSCIFGHKGIELPDETRSCGTKITFTTEKCIRCDSRRVTVIGYGGISIKKWESKEKYEKSVKEMKETDQKYENAIKKMDDAVKEYTIKSMERQKQS